jgi:hypothetical protein
VASAVGAPTCSPEAALAIICALLCDVSQLAALTLARRQVLGRAPQLRAQMIAHEPLHTFAFSVSRSLEGLARIDAAGIEERGPRLTRPAMRSASMIAAAAPCSYATSGSRWPPGPRRYEALEDWARSRFPDPRGGLPMVRPGSRAHGRGSRADGPVDPSVDEAADCRPSARARPVAVHLPPHAVARPVHPGGPATAVRPREQRGPERGSHASVLSGGACVRLLLG